MPLEAREEIGRQTELEEGWRLGMREETEPRRQHGPVCMEGLGLGGAVRMHDTATAAAAIQLAVLRRGRAKRVNLHWALVSESL